MVSEISLKKAFRKIREDMENLQHQILDIRQKVEDIDAVLLEKEAKTSKKSKKKR